jgi:hypothetical protein
MYHGRYIDGMPEAQVTDWCTENDLKKGELLNVIGSPWSSVWRVRDLNGSSYVLKVLKKVQLDSLNIYQILSDELCPKVPKLLRSIPPKGLYLFEDLGQGSASVIDILRQYARIQSHFLENQRPLKKIPTLLSSEVLERFEALMDLRSEGSDTNIFKFFEDKHLDEIRRRFDRQRQFIRSLVDRVDNSRPTINHSDLIRQNAIKPKDGETCIIDWDFAISSAPGWSLPQRYEGCLRVFTSLFATELYKSPRRRNVDVFCMEAYLDELGLSSVQRRDVKKVIPAAAVFSTLRDATSLLPFSIPVDDTPNGWIRSIRRSLLHRIPQIFVVLELLQKLESCGRPPVRKRIPL